jgi:hypothetical protein
MKKKEEKLSDVSYSLITTEAKEVIVSYPLGEDEDDNILTEIREALGNNKVYCGSGWADFEMKMGGQTLDDLDMKKIIGIRW